MTRHLTVLALSLILLLAGGAAQAQSDAVISAGIQFNFSTPGARSLGLGGAFVGLTDDATAAYTNPAGLTILSRPEVSLEGRSWSYSNEFSVRGHGFGPPTNTGVDTIAGIQTREFEDDTSGLSFASFVYPRGRWALAVYRHELANFETHAESQGPFFDVTDPDPGRFRFFPFRANLSLDIVNYGASGAFRITDNVSLGLGAAYYEFELESLTRRFGFLNPDPTAPGGFFGPPDFSSDNLINFQDQLGNDDDIAAIVGLLWDISPRWSLGAVYRQGPSFEFDVRSFFADGTLFDEQTTEFNVPDVYAVGVAFKPTETLTVTFDYDLVEYSDLLGEPTSLFGDPSPEEEAALRRLEIEDADEFHLGLEYVWVDLPYPMAFRVGTYHDPAHRIHFRGTANGTVEERALAAQFRSSDDEFHYSAGLGVVFGNFQVDAAADFSDLVETVSLSGVYRF